MACYLRLDDATLIYDYYPTPTSFCLLTYPLCLYLTRSYEVQPQAGSLESLRRPLLGLLIAIAASSLFFYLAPQVRFGRGIFAIVNGLLIFTLPAWRFAIFRLLRHRRLNYLLMGNPAAVEMACELIWRAASGRAFTLTAGAPSPPRRITTTARAPRPLRQITDDRFAADTRRQDRADPARRRDALVVHRLRHERDRRPCAARRARRPQAFTAAHPRRHERPRPGPHQAAPQVRQDRRRHLR